jgi:dihydroorotase (multifunctional complex type)
MDFDLVIKGGEICVPSGRFRLDIGVQGEKIAALATPGQLSGQKELDVSGKTVTPGFIHPHVHMREPGLEYKEDYESGTMAAAAGGFTCTIDMPNVQPVTTTVERYLEKKELASGKAYVDFQHWPGPTKPDEIRKFGKVSGIPGIKEFMVRDPKAKYPHMPELAIANHGDLFLLMQATRDIGHRMLIHGEDPDLMYAMSLPFLDDKKYTARNELTSYKIAGTNSTWQFATRDIGSTVAIMMARLAGMKVHILHIGQGRYMHRYVKRAKEEGQDITGELESLWLVEKQTDPKIRKRLELGNFRAECDYAEELWEAVNDGTVDIVLMEHAPHTLDEIMGAENDVWDAPGGVPTLQEMMPLLLTEVNRGKTSLERLVLLTSENPARIAGLYPRKGAIQVGSDADLAVIDMKKKLKLSDKDMISRTGFTAFDGYTVTGVPIYTIVRGQIVMQDGKVTGKKGYGKYIPSSNPQ